MAPGFEDELERHDYEIGLQITYDENVKGAVSHWQFHTGNVQGAGSAPKQKPVALSRSFFETYHRCISRLQFSPMLHTPICQAPGAIRADNVDDWMQLHVSTANAVLDNANPDEIWFHTPPHVGIDNVLAEVARGRDIPVIICTSLPVFGKFDYHFQGEIQIPRLADGWAKTEFDDFSPDLFYMANVISGQLREPAPSWLSLVRSRSLAHLVDAVYRGALKRDWALPMAVMDAIFERDRSLALWRYSRRRRLRKNRRRLKTARIDELRAPFVYFSLHYEPEAIVSSVPYPFCNQVNAMEALLAIAPSDWIVAVKENPKQRLMFRDDAFFERIKANPRLVWLSPETESSEAVRNARATASLAGTAGYESLLAGRPCIYFGNAWYRHLPGAFAYDPGLDLQAICQQRIDKQAVSECVNQFFSTRPDGMMHPRNRNLAPADVDLNEVARQTARSMTRISRHGIEHR